MLNITCLDIDDATSGDEDTVILGQLVGTDVDHDDADLTCTLHLR